MDEDIEFNFNSKQHEETLYNHYDGDMCEELQIGEDSYMEQSNSTIISDYEIGECYRQALNECDDISDGEELDRRFEEQLICSGVRAGARFVRLLGSL
jgi:hypothetical protein